MNSDKQEAKYTLLNSLTLLDVHEEPVEGSVAISYSQGPEQPDITFYFAPVQSAVAYRNLGEAITFPFFPFIECKDGAPWPEGNLWLLDILANALQPNPITFIGRAADLVAYRKFLDTQKNLNWLDFPQFKLHRPTYKYRSALIAATDNGSGSVSLAKRRISTITTYYKWVTGEVGQKLENPAFNEKEKRVSWRNSYGAPISKEAATTDLSIPAPLVEDPWDGCLVDDGRLRPLPREEQQAFLDALLSSSNTEMVLIHLLLLFTGARVQTGLTMRARHFQKYSRTSNEVRIKAGPGTGIDTKKRKRGVLHVPMWLYEMLHIYSDSPRAIKRREKQTRTDSHGPLLFLSNRGAPLYDTKEMGTQIGRSRKRYVSTGQAIRDFKKHYLLPKMRKALNSPEYNFRHHDLRATFGLNVADAMTPLIASGKLTWVQALDQLRQLMWHSSVGVTERYLTFRSSQKTLQAANDEWHSHLATLAQRYMKDVE